MNRCRVSMVVIFLAVCLLGCWWSALPGEALAERCDIVVGGKMTDDARITGTTKPAAWQEHPPKTGRAHKLQLMVWQTDSTVSLTTHTDEITWTS